MMIKICYDVYQLTDLLVKLEDYCDEEINITQLEEDILDELGLEGIAQYHIVYFKDIRIYSDGYNLAFKKLQVDLNIEDEDLIIIQAP